MRINPLICFPSPRDIKIVLDEWAKIDYVDKYWVKYTSPERTVYKFMRDYFLQHDGYTHMVIAPDDLLVRGNNFATLVTDLNQFDLPIISGLCNLDSQDHNKGLLNICINELPHADQNRRIYRWITEEEVKAQIEKGINLQRVQFAGFPLMFIRRDVVEQIPFRDDSNDPVLYGCCIDVCWCWDCAQKGIPIYVDNRVIMKHLKVSDGIYEQMQIGNKAPRNIFEQAKRSAPF